MQPSTSQACASGASEEDPVFLQQFWNLYDTAVATIRRNGFSPIVPVNWAAGIQTNFPKEFLDEIYSVAFTGTYSEQYTTSLPAHHGYSFSQSQSPATSNGYPAQFVGQPLPAYTFASSYEDFFASLSSSSTYNRANLLSRYHGTNMNK